MKSDKTLSAKKFTHFEQVKPKIYKLKSIFFIKMRNSLSIIDNRFGKERTLLLCFTFVYIYCILLGLTNMTVLWDEATHLDIGVTLAQGRFSSYLNSGPFYPPLYDLVIAGFFKIGGISLFNGRLVSVMFTVLSIWMLFEFGKSLFNPKKALVAAVLLGIMPGLVLLSRQSVIETMLLFLFTLSLLFFYRWLKFGGNMNIILSSVVLGLGVLAKYQAIVAAIIMIMCIFALTKGSIKSKMKPILFMICITAIFVIPWLIINFQAFTDHTLNQWLYVFQMGSPQKSAYGSQFPTPLFYLLALTWPYGPTSFAPISIFVYIFALLGFVVLVWNHRLEDKFLITWAVTVYVFFTLVGNKDWRYMLVAFPVLALSASNLMAVIYQKFGKYIRAKHRIGKTKLRVKSVAILLMAIICFSIAWNCIDTTLWIIYKDKRSLPVQEATDYVSEFLTLNQSVLVVAPYVQLSNSIVHFYLQLENKNNNALQYPDTPVDTYQPNFNANELVNICEKNNVKYLLLPDNASTLSLFNTTITLTTFYNSLNETGRFRIERSFGNTPYRIFVETFV